MARRFHIQFDTNDAPGRLKAVWVELGIDFKRADNKPMRVDLCDHPQYEALERYVLANPSKAHR